MQAAADAQSISLAEASQNLVTTLDIDTEDEDDSASLLVSPLLARDDEVERGGSPYEEGTDHYDRTRPEAALSTLLRADKEKQYTLSVAWGLEPDKRKAADGHRAVIKPEVLEETAWNFMRNRKVGLYHQDGTEGHGEVVESYIYRGPDWEMVDATGAKQLIRAGYWLVGNVWDKAAWGLIKRGLLNGLSPQGSAMFKRVKNS
jgi:hypothetical protein